MDLIQGRREFRKKKINRIANFIANEYIEFSQLNLEKIVNEESIPVFFDHYEDCFDGLLFYESKQFYIHVNIDKGNIKDSKRSRFSIAHELGHYFIPEHHQSIINGTFPCHPSKFKANQFFLENEADYFASCLLMPSELFKNVCYRKKFSFDLIKQISGIFNVSELSVLLRFADDDAGTYPLMISFFKQGVLAGYKQSNDFPYKNIPFKTKIGNPPPPTSVIGEYYIKNENKFKDVQEIYVDDWFWRPSNQKLKEQCFYSDYGYDVSVIWPD